VIPWKIKDTFLCANIEQFQSQLFLFWAPGRAAPGSAGASVFFAEKAKKNRALCIPGAETAQLETFFL